MRLIAAKAREIAMLNGGTKESYYRCKSVRNTVQRIESCISREAHDGATSLEFYFVMSQTNGLRLPSREEVEEIGAELTKYGYGWLLMCIDSRCNLEIGCCHLRIVW